VAGPAEKVTSVEPDEGTKLLCCVLVRRLGPRASRGELELRFRLVDGDVQLQELLLKERFSANELAQFDRGSDGSS
jgi:hypothetical protein